MKYDIKLSGNIDSNVIETTFSIEADDNIQALFEAQETAIDYLDTNNLISQEFFDGGGMYIDKNVMCRDISYCVKDKWYNFILEIQ